LQKPAVQTAGTGSLGQRAGTGSLRARGERIVTRVAEAQDVTIELNNEEDPESTVSASLAGSRVFRFARYVRTSDQHAGATLASSAASTVCNTL
jgi:hypothetical protein